MNTNHNFIVAAEKHRSMCHYAVYLFNPFKYFKPSTLDNETMYFNCFVIFDPLVTFMESRGRNCIYVVKGQTCLRAEDAAAASFALG